MANFNIGSAADLDVNVFANIIPQPAQCQIVATISGTAGLQYPLMILGQATNSQVSSGIYITTLAKGDADCNMMAVEADTYSAPDAGTTQSFNTAIIAYAANRGPGTVTEMYGIGAQTDCIGGTTVRNSAFLAYTASSAGTIHNNFGFQSQSQAGVGDTLNAAFYAADQGSGTNDYAFYSAGGKSKFDRVSVSSNAPSSASASGEVGTITWDSDYIYVCIATNSWKRSPISSW